jgi:hypothetical protein
MIKNLFIELHKDFIFSNDFISFFSLILALFPSLATQGKGKKDSERLSLPCYAREGSSKAKNLLIIYY